MKIAIIGGGASGLSCAIEGAQTALRKGIKAEITIFEAKDRVGKKILATGNGRCNMMNIHDDVPYFGDNNFAKTVLKKFSVKSNLRFFSEMGLYTRSDEEGRIYPLSNQATGVLDALRFECARLKVKTVTDSEIIKIEKKGSKFLLNGEILFDKVVFACGSCAQVKNFSGYELIQSLGHTVTKINPSLTKLTVKNPQKLKALKGVRQKVELKLAYNRKLIAEEKGEILFADYGLSGIAVMQLSAYVARMDMKRELPVVSVDLVPDFDKNSLLKELERLISRNRNGTADNLLTGFMPKKIGEAVLKDCGISVGTTFDKLQRKDLIKITETAKSWCFEINGTKDFSDGQVVSGGVKCSEFSNETLESKKHKGLYCCGELLDIDGLCGGYNLGWAWSSGRLCGKSMITGE